MRELLKEKTVYSEMCSYVVSCFRAEENEFAKNIPYGYSIVVQKSNYIKNNNRNSAPLMSHSVFLDKFFMDEDAEKFFNTVTNDDFFLSFLYRDEMRINNVEFLFEYFDCVEKIVEQGLPESIAYVFSLLTDGNYSVFEELLNTGAAIQVNNDTKETSIEIFARIYQKFGVDVVKRVFTIFGSSIQEQKRFLPAILKMNKASAESLVNVSEEIFIYILNVLSFESLTEVDTGIFYEVIKDFNKKDWSKISQFLSLKREVEDYNFLLNTELSEEEYDRMRSWNSLFQYAESKKSINSRGIANSNDMNEYVNAAIAITIYKFGIEEFSQAYEAMKEHVKKLAFKYEDDEYYVKRFVNNQSNRITIGSLMAILVTGLDLNPALTLATYGYEDDIRLW